MANPPTDRADNARFGPGVVVGLAFFVVYMVWAGLQTEYFSAGPYVSPAFVPLFYVDPTAHGSASIEQALLGRWPRWWPDFIPSPSFLIVVVPLAFRGGGCCYYRGEMRVLSLLYLHRATLYIGLALLPFLFYEAFSSLYWFDMSGEKVLGIGVGSGVLFVNAMLLSANTLGCNAWRHLVGGRLEKWSFTAWLNARHLQLAWISLYWFLFSDVYVRLVSMGLIADLNTWHGVTWVGAF